jgi:hypothetical protein
VVPGAVRGNPFSVLDNYGVMNRMWSISVFPFRSVVGHRRPDS